MDIDLIFKIAAVGILVSVLNQVLTRSGREEQATMTTLAGLIVVLMMVVQKISDLLWNTLPLLETIWDVVQELAQLADISPTVLRPLLQTVGLAVVTRMAGSLCRDAGEGSIAAFLEVAGSAAAVLVALPLLKMVLQLILQLL